MDRGDAAVDAGTATPSRRGSMLSIASSLIAVLGLWAFVYFSLIVFNVAGPKLVVVTAPGRKYFTPHPVFDWLPIAVAICGVAAVALASVHDHRYGEDRFSKLGRLLGLLTILLALISAFFWYNTLHPYDE